ncbi:ribosome assembly protein 4 [Thecamonas trahens ATCC 50062]|uniref:Ribosome assembly protein 4 n=1 Tax=Thecamonas trahens ATCC 50062 TaxID=461836 RepID=A0A0L0DJ97_THETB|nr:ribosome assembly protein 4 [Thecamonas trahens ATCC 50062]KNC52382.1 ribosome assembly protein 4 [Thecamonas trahens ATCC 50062]|eukprot:XP_013755427.1 ribosome assembly protein 4 [Thecamonas trahens ATCC 50062]
MALVALQKTTVTVGLKSEGRVFVYDKETDGLVVEARVPFRLTALINGPRDVVYLGGEAGNLVAVSLISGTVICSFLGHYADVDWLFFTHGALVSASAVDRSLRRWDIETGACLMRYVGPGDVLTSALVKDGVPGIFAGAFNGRVYLWRCPWSDQLGGGGEASGRPRHLVFDGEMSSSDASHEAPDRPGGTGGGVDEGRVGVSGGGDEVLGEREEDETEEEDESGVELVGSEPPASPLGTTPIMRPWKVMESHIKHIHCMEADENSLFTASNDKSICVWSVHDGSLLQVLKVPQRRTSTQFMVRDGNYLYTANKDKTVRKWDLATGECVAVWVQHCKTIFDLKIHERFLFSSSMDKCVCQWDLVSGQLVQTFRDHHSRTIRAVETDGRVLYSASEDGTVSKWSVATGEHLIKFDNRESHATCMYVDDNSGSLFFSHGAELYRWDLASGICIQRYTGCTDDINVLRVSGSRLWAAGAGAAIYLWDVETGELLTKMMGHSRTVFALVVSEDDGAVFSGSLDKTIRKWRLGGEAVARLRRHHKSIQKLCVHRGILFSGSYDHTIISWDMHVRGPVHLYSAHTKSIKCMLMVDGYMFSGSFDHDIRVWSVEAGTQVGHLTGHRKSVVCLATEPLSAVDISNSALVTSPDGVVRPLSGLASHLRLDYSSGFHPGDPVPDGVHPFPVIYSGSDDCTVRAWRVAGHFACIMVYRGHLRGVQCLEVEPGGRHLLSGSGDGQIRRWSAQTGACVQVFDGHFSSVVSLVQLTRGVLLSSSQDGTVRKWNITVPTLRELCVRKVREMRTAVEHESTIMEELRALRLPRDVTDAILGRVPAMRSEIVARITPELAELFPVSTGGEAGASGASSSGGAGAGAEAGAADAADRAN